MFKFLFKLLLTASVSFLAFQMHDNNAIKNSMLLSAKFYLSELGLDNSLKNFDCFHCTIFYVLMLAPLGLVATNLLIATKLAGVAVFVLGFLTEFDKENPMNINFWKYVAIGFGLLCAGKSAKACAKK